MKKITGLFISALLLLSSCGSVPVTGRKQVLLVSDSEVCHRLLYAVYEDFNPTFFARFSAHFSNFNKLRIQQASANL